jgi:N-acetylglucosamine kinase-like BadF-type ATPase
MTYVLGIDAGNSKTLAMVADDTGAVLGAGRSGSGSHQAVGIAESMETVRAAAFAALARGRIAPSEVAAAFYALAGADLEFDFDILRPAIAGQPLAPRWELDNDVVAALRSGTDSPDAVAVVLGTGFNAMGRSARGQVFRLAGLGWKSGDWGGGGELAREAIRLSVRQWDGRGAPTMLHDAVLRILHVPDVEALILALHTQTIEENDYLAVVPAILEAAAAGDALALDLVRRTADETTATALALLRRLDLLTTETDLVLAGSVFRSRNALLMEAISSALDGQAPAVRFIVPDVEPAVGAVLCAMDVAGIVADQAVRERLGRTSLAALQHTFEARL